MYAPQFWVNCGSLRDSQIPVGPARTRWGRCSVHTHYELSTGLCLLRSDITVLWLSLLLSTNSVHNILVQTKYLLSIYLVHTEYMPVFTQYVRSTGLCPLHSDITVLLLCLLLSTNSVHNILVQTKYVHSTYWVHTDYTLVYTQYWLSTYSVHGYTCCAVTSQSCYSVYFWVQTLCILGMAQCSIGTPHAIVQYHLFCSALVHTSL